MVAGETKDKLNRMLSRVLGPVLSGPTFIHWLEPCTVLWSVTLLPDVSPDSVAGKVMVLLLISTRAGGACGVCWLLAASLVTDSIGVAT